MRYLVNFFFEPVSSFAYIGYSFQELYNWKFVLFQEIKSKHYQSKDLPNFGGPKLGTSLKGIQRNNDTIAFLQN